MNILGEQNTRSILRGCLDLLAKKVEMKSCNLGVLNKKIFINFFARMGCKSQMNL